MVEGEDEDDFGELYWDVLQPFSCSGNVKCEESREEKEVVGSVRLEIYMGSRRVLENSFVFSLGKKKKKNGNHDSKCEMVGRDPPQHNSDPERYDEVGDHGTGRIISRELISDGYNKAPHLQNTRPSVRPMLNRYHPYLSLFDLDLESLEYRPWRHPSVDLSHYFNYGLDETSWKIYCHQLKIYAGKQIHGEDEPTILPPDQNKCFLQGNTNQQQDNNSKRPKIVEDDESWSNISDNEWMCRKDRWFHPIRHHHHQEEEEEESDRRKSSRKGRSKLERWTRHDRDENTSTSTSSPPP